MRFQGSQGQWDLRLGHGGGGGALTVRPRFWSSVWGSTELQKLTAGEGLWGPGQGLKRLRRGGGRARGRGSEWQVCLPQPSSSRGEGTVGGELMGSMSCLQLPMASCPELPTLDLHYIFSSQGRWVARRASQVSQVQRPTHLSSRERQDPRCPDVSPPPALLRNLESRPHSESPGGFWSSGPCLPPLGARSQLSYLLTCLPLSALQLSGNSHLFLIYGTLFPPNRTWGILTGKGAYVQIPQEIILSDSFPRTTWRLRLPFPPWL